MRNHGEARSGRSEVIDFWRGLVLIIIFINHIPGNIFEKITTRNFGFSDSAEAFVFISGLSIALAYGNKIACGDCLGVINRSWRRACFLYAIHLLLTFTAITLYAWAFVFSNQDILILGGERDAVFEAPARTVLSILSLKYQLGYFNILPLYVVLMLGAPFMLFAAWRAPILTLLISGAVYVVVQFCPAHFFPWTGYKGWFFNPLAWQFIFTIGMSAGIAIKHGGKPTLVSPILTGMCCTVLLLSLLIRTDIFGLKVGLYGTIHGMGGFDKTPLNIMRLLHFLALAYVLAHFKVGNAFIRWPFGKTLVLMGRHGLVIFSAGSILSMAGQIVVAMIEGTRLANATLVGLTIIPAGIVCLYWLARYFEGPEMQKAIAYGSEKTLAGTVPEKI